MAANKNNMKFAFKIILLIALALIAFGGCFRGQPSDKAPIHLNPDMDNQPRYDPQSESRFFSDSSTMRPLPAGTVARGTLKDNVFDFGRNSDGSFVSHSPVPLNMTSLKRGQERYNIYCAVCHGRAGDGQGIMISRGYVPPPTFHSDRLLKFVDGEFFEVITNGIRNMPAYRYQISAADRWAVINYIRALQRSHNATINDVPVELRDKVK